MISPPHRNSGFSLIQISILLAVVAMTMVAMLPSSQSNLTANNTSTVKMNTVFTAMRAYEAANGYLPCPADPKLAIGATNYGVQAANGGATTNCTGSTPAANFVDTTNHVAIGMVPVRTLGLPYSYAQDGFGRDITYAVDTNATSCWASTTLTGQITVADNGSYNTTVAALVSHGADGHGAYLPYTGSATLSAPNRMNAGSTDTDELVNAHITTGTFPTAAASSFLAWSGNTTASTTFVKKPPTSTFDDLVVYSSPLWNINTLPVIAPAAAAPTVTAPTNGAYLSGQTLTFTLTFTKVMTVTGTPRLDLAALGSGTMGSSNVAYANYTSGSGTTALVFTYTVLSTDYAPSGIQLTSSSIDLNGGSISPCAGAFTAPSLTGVILGECVYVVDYGNDAIRKITSAGALSTIAGTGSYGSATYNGQSATSVALATPEDTAVDSSGNVYIAAHDTNQILKVSTSGTITAAVGTGSQGYSANGTTATSAKLNAPMGVAVDSSGNVYIADTGNYVVREVSGGKINTIAGNHTSGFSGNNGAATSAEFTTPSGVTVDSSGNYYISDIGNNADTVRKVTIANSYVYAFAGSGTYGTVTPGPATSSELALPYYAAVDSSGNVYIAAHDDNQVLKVTQAGVLSVFAGTGAGQFGGDGGTATSARISAPQGVAVDAVGNVFISDNRNNRIREVFAVSDSSHTAGDIYTIAGNGTAGFEDNAVATSGELNGPVGMSVTSACGR